MEFRSQPLPAFIKDHLPFVYPFTQPFLFFRGKRDNLHAFFTAAAIIFFSALLTLNKQQVASFVLTVGMPVAGPSALVAMTDDLLSHPFSQPFIKYKVLPEEFIFYT